MVRPIRKAALSALGKLNMMRTQDSSEAQSPGDAVANMRHEESYVSLDERNDADYEAELEELLNDSESDNDDGPWGDVTAQEDYVIEDEPDVPMTTPAEAIGMGEEEFALGEEEFALENDFGDNRVTKGKRHLKKQDETKFKLPKNARGNYCWRWTPRESKEEPFTPTNNKYTTDIGPDEAPGTIFLWMIGEAIQILLDKTNKYGVERSENGEVSYSFNEITRPEMLKFIAIILSMGVCHKSYYQ